MKLFWLGCTVRGCTVRTKCLTPVGVLLIVPLTNVTLCQLCRECPTPVGVLLTARLTNISLCQLGGAEGEEEEEGSREAEQEEGVVYSLATLGHTIPSYTHTQAHERSTQYAYSYSYSYSHSCLHTPTQKVVAMRTTESKARLRVDLDGVVAEPPLEPILGRSQ